MSVYVIVLDNKCKELLLRAEKKKTLLTVPNAMRKAPVRCLGNSAAHTTAGYSGER